MDGTMTKMEAYEVAAHFQGHMVTFFRKSCRETVTVDDLVRILKNTARRSAMKHAVDTGLHSEASPEAAFEDSDAEASS